MTRPQWLTDAEIDAARAAYRDAATLIAAEIERHPITAPAGSEAGREQRRLRSVLSALLADVLLRAPR